MREIHEEIIKDAPIKDNKPCIKDSRISEVFKKYGYTIFSEKTLQNDILNIEKEE